MKYIRDLDYALKVIDECLYGTLSMIDGDGYPYGIPINLVRVGEYIYFHGSRKGKKIELLESKPMVSLSGVGKTMVIEEEFTTIYQSAIVAGVIEFVLSSKEKLMALRELSLKYTPSVMDRFEAEAIKGLEYTEVFKMKIMEISGKGKID